MDVLKDEALKQRFARCLFIETKIDDQGNVIPWGALSKSYTYAGPSGAMDTITGTDGVNSWRITYTYTGANLTNESLPVKL